MRKCYIYRLIRKDTNEVLYVGSTTRKDRLNQFNRPDQPYFQAFVDEIGKENCISEVIEECDEDDRFDREAYWTIYYWENYNLVNRTIANNRYTEDLRDIVFNEETRQRMRDAWSEERRRAQAEKGWTSEEVISMWKDPNRLERMKHNVKKWWTPERRKARSETTSGVNNPNYGKGEKTRGELNGMYGVHLTGELNGMWGKHHSEETLKLMSDRIKERFKDPQLKERMKRSHMEAQARKRDSETLPISEIFLSLQGEGVNSGKPTIFIRTFGCPLDCTYCDSTYATKGNDFTMMSVTDIIKRCDDIGKGCKQVCLTGGEPLNFEYSRRLINKLVTNKYYVDVETSGCIDIKTFKRPDQGAYIRFTVDYKCPSSGMQDKMLDDTFNHLQSNDTLKFVVGNINDLDCMKSVINRFNPRCTIYVSPIFGAIELKDIADYILSNNLFQVRLQIQLHKFVWPIDARGV